MQDDSESFNEKYEQDLKERWGKVRISAMVLGPNTDAKSLGAKLRRFIIERCKEYATPVKGESERVTNVHKQIFGHRHNLCSMESDMAHKQVDAVVIIPDSPGSLVELGMFALEDKVCSKCLVLFSDKYEKDEKPNFIRLGPQLSYHFRGAKTPVVNYRERDKVWQLVKDFLLDQKARKFDTKQRE